MFCTKLIKLYHRYQRTFIMSSEGSASTWRGVPLSEVHGSSSPWGAPEFPLIVPGYYHTVLYHIPSNSEFPADRPPKPRVGLDMWDKYHVRMPCSSHSLYPVKNRNGGTNLKKRWEMIENSLNKPIRNSKELADVILSYNYKFENIWRFKALHKLFNEYLEEDEAQYFFDVTLPQIVKLALNLPKLIQAPIPLLRKTRNHSVSLSQQQISSLLANAFFCTFPRRNTTKTNSEYASYPFINFNRLYESSGSDHVLEKLKCICHYFRRVTTKVPCGVVTFSRRYVPSARLPAWRSDPHSLANLPVHVDTGGTIEDSHGLIQVDFANKYLGGGVLNYGCVQEEIRFMICPELLISMLFTEVMTSNEAVLIIGCERYSNYTGYGNTFQWSGDHVEPCPTDSSHRRRTAVLAIDATPHYNEHNDQYTEKAIVRDLNKAWVGFSFFTSEPSNLQYPGIATGNWGCGAFCGAPQLKSLLQLMACAVAGRPLAYYTFGDDEIRDDLVNICNLLARYNVTVGQLFSYIVKFSETAVAKSRTAHDNFHPFLYQQITGDSGRRIDPRPIDEPITIRESSDKDISMESRMELQNLSEQHSEFQFSSELQREFQNSIEFGHSKTPQKQSPDIFSQGEEESLTEIKIHNDKEATLCNDKTASSQREIDPKSSHRTIDQAASSRKATEQSASNHRTADQTLPNSSEIDPISSHMTINKIASSHREIDPAASSYTAINQTSSSHRLNDLTVLSHREIDPTASSHRMNDQAASSHRLIDKTTSSHRAIDKTTPNHRSIETSNTKSRLVEAMQRLEQESSIHNISVSKPSPFKHNSSISLSDVSEAMDTSDCDVVDPKADMKKRVSRKITDYFGKKTI